MIMSKKKQAGISRPVSIFYCKYLYSHYIFLLLGHNLIYLD